MHQNLRSGPPWATCNRIAACAMISRRTYPRKGCSVQTSSEPTVVRVRPSTQTVSKQGLPGSVGVSGDTVGADGLSLKLIVIPPGGKAAAHRHVGYEPAIYMLTGRVETKYGENLEESIITEPGDFYSSPPAFPTSRLT
jgi:uncharacterized RmlC-like cupin family protein